MRAVRIDDVIAGADGSVEVRFTTGASPLPAKWQGQGMRWTDREQFAEALRAVEALLDESVLVPLLAAQWLRADPALANRTFLKGRGLTVDLAASSPLTATGGNP